MNEITIKIANPMHHDKLQTLSAEYTTTIELLVNLAVKRFIQDVEIIRDLRIGIVELD